MAPTRDTAVKAGIAALLIAVAAAIYFPVARFDFVNYDDDLHVYANPYVAGGFSAEGLRKAFTRFHVGHWIPLTMLSHTLDAELFGLNAGGHHLMNVALHLAAAVLIFLVLGSLTRKPWRSALVAALFLVHPLNVQTVAWVSERKNILSTIFWLLAIGAWARWTRTRRTRDYALTVALFLGGLLCKSMIVTLPLTLLVLDIWPLERLSARGLLTAEGRRRAVPLIVEKIPLFVIAASASALTWIGQASERAVTDLSSFPLRERLLNALVSLGWYLQKALVPAGLSVSNPHPSSLGELVSRPLAFGSLLILTVLFAAALSRSQKQPYLSAGLLWYFVTLLPVIGLVQVGAQAHCDHFAYVPLIGIWTASVWLLADATSGSRAGTAAAVAAVVLTGLFAAAAHVQLRYWRDSETLWVRALAVNHGRSAIARNNLAAHYNEKGRRLKESGDPASALKFFLAAGDAQPDSAKALYNQAAALSDLQRYAEAIPRYEESLRRDPGNADAWLNAGDAFVMTRNFTAAVNAYQRTLALRPDRFADYGLAFACAKLGDATCADAAYERLRTADPRLARDLLAQWQRETR